MRKDVLLLFGIVCGVVLIYARHLDVSPPALHPDEVATLREARSIAQSGRDLEGRRLPLFFHVHDNVWIPPAAVYFTAVLLPILGAGDSSVRVASVVVAAVDVILIYVVAARVFGRTGLAVLAAALLALTPLHFIHGRLGLAGVYPVPFILGWLFFLAEFVKSGQLRPLFLAAASLGLGFYAHPSSVLTMPALLILTLATMWMRRRRSIRDCAAPLAGFALPLVILIPWFAWHYDVFRFTLGDWGLHSLANPRDGLRYSILNWPALATRSTVYWGFFSPSFLFFTGGADLVGSTRQAGVFLGVIAIPLVFGVYHIVTSRWSDPLWRAILIAFALAPVAAAAFNEPKAAGRTLGMLPLGILIAVAGIEALAADGSRLRRLAAVAVLLVLPFQFYRFYDDYYTGYPQRASAAFGQGVARE